MRISTSIVPPERVGISGTPPPDVGVTVGVGVIVGVGMIVGEP